MRNLLYAGTLGLSLASAAAAVAATSVDAPKPAANQLVEGRAAYVTPISEFGQVGNDFGPGFNFGAPATAKDFGGAEVSADAVVLK